jgi:excinuclease ABC subunit C
MARARVLPSGLRPNTKEEIAALRSAALCSVKNKPGVYRMISEDGGVLYVGKSKRLRTRLQSYFRGEPHEKGARILQETKDIAWEYCPSEFAALLTELRMIKRWRPRFNVAMKRDDRRYVFIKVTRGRAPKLYVVRGSGGGGGSASGASALYYGPFSGASYVRQAVRALNDALGLRDCSEDVKMLFSDQQELFSIGRRTPGCIRYEVKKCLGPCVAGCSSQQYEARLKAAREFLEGRSDGPVDGLRGDMEAASARLEFERAASLRNKVQRLDTLREQFSRLRFALESLSFLYTVPGQGGDDRIYLVRRGTVRAEIKANPASDDERRALDRLIEEVYSPLEPARAPVPSHEIDEILLLSSWFNRFPSELERTRPAVL